MLSVVEGKFGAVSYTAIMDNCRDDGDGDELASSSHFIPIPGGEDRVENIKMTTLDEPSKGIGNARDGNNKSHGAQKLRMSASEFLESEGGMEASLPSTSTFSSGHEVPKRRSTAASADKDVPLSGDGSSSGRRRSDTTSKSAMEAPVPPRRPETPRSPQLPSTSTWSAVPSVRPRSDVGRRDVDVSGASESRGKVGSQSVGGGDSNGSVHTRESDADRSHRAKKLCMSAGDLLDLEGGMEASLPSTSTFSFGSEPAGRSAVATNADVMRSRDGSSSAGRRSATASKPPGVASVTPRRPPQRPPSPQLPSTSTWSAVHSVRPGSTVGRRRVSAPSESRGRCSSATPRSDATRIGGRREEEPDSVGENCGSGRTNARDGNKSQRAQKLHMSTSELLEREVGMEASLPSTSTFSTFKTSVVTGDRPQGKGEKEGGGDQSSDTTTGKPNGGGRSCLTVSGPPMEEGIQQPKPPGPTLPPSAAAEETMTTSSTAPRNGNDGDVPSHSRPPMRGKLRVITSEVSEEGEGALKDIPASGSAPPIASAAPTNTGGTSRGNHGRKEADDGTSEMTRDDTSKSTASTTDEGVKMSVDGSSSTRRRSTVASKPPVAAPAPPRRPPPRSLSSSSSWSSGLSTTPRSAIGDRHVSGASISRGNHSSATPRSDRTRLDERRKEERESSVRESSSSSGPLARVASRSGEGGDNEENSGPGQTDANKTRKALKRCMSASALLEGERDLESRLPSSLSRSTSFKTSIIAGERPQSKGRKEAEEQGCHSSDATAGNPSRGGKLCLMASEVLKETIQRPKSCGPTSPSLHAVAATATNASITSHNGKNYETSHAGPPSRGRLRVATNEVSEGGVLKEIPAPSSTLSAAAAAPTNCGTTEEGLFEPKTDLRRPSLPSSLSTTKVTPIPSITASTSFSDSMAASEHLNERVLGIVAPETNSCRPLSSPSSTTTVAPVPSIAASMSLKDGVNVEDDDSVHANTSNPRQQQDKLYMPASELLEKELGVGRIDNASSSRNGRGSSASSPSLLGLRLGRSASFRERSLSSPRPRSSSSSSSLRGSSSVALRPSSMAGRVESSRRSPSFASQVTAEMVFAGAGKGSTTTNDTDKEIETSNKKPPTGLTTVTKGNTVGAGSASLQQQQRASSTPASATRKKFLSDVDSLDVLCTRSTEKCAEATGGRSTSLPSVQPPSTKGLRKAPASSVLRRSSTPRANSAPGSLPVSSSKPVTGQRSTGQIVLLGARNAGNVRPAAKKDNDDGVTKQKDDGDKKSTLPTSKQSSLPRKENESNSLPSTGERRKNNSTTRQKDNSLGSTHPSGTISKQHSGRHIGRKGQSKSVAPSSQTPGSRPSDRNDKQRRGSGMNPSPLAVHREKSQRRMDSEQDDQQKATETRRNLDKRTARLRYANDFKADIATHKASSTRFVVSAADRRSTSEMCADLRNRCRTRSGVTVFVRKRPIFKYELDRGDYDVVSIVDGSTNTSTTMHEMTRDEVVMHCCSMHPDMRQMYVKEVSYPCTAAFDERCSNDDVFDCIAEPLVRASAAGGVSTILMQGQTGSGKSYTMTGLEERACGCLFDAAAEWSHAKAVSGNAQDRVSLMPTVTVTFIELAGKKCKDLLGSASKEAAPTRIVDGEDGSVRILNAQHKVVNCADDLFRLISHGKSRRATEATDKNGVSSRSHAVCQIVLSYEGMDCGQRGVLTLIDCAGSERRHDSLHHSSERQRESAEINASLWSLKECIRARAHNDTQPLNENTVVHVPYRSSNLTRILRESFERKDASLCIIGTVSPNATDTEHSMETLKMLSTIVGQENLLKEGESRLVVAKIKKRSIAPRDWDNKQLVSWLQRKGFQLEHPEDMDGRRIMKMTAMQLSMQFGGDKAKAQSLFNLLRLESDRIAKKQLKERIETKNVRRSTTSL